MVGLSLLTAQLQWVSSIVQNFVKNANYIPELVNRSKIRGHTHTKDMFVNIYIQYKQL